MVFRAGSAEEMAEQSDFQNLPDDEYLATVEAMEFDSAEGKPAGLYGAAVDQYRTTLKLHSFADGSPLEDTEGNPVEGDFPLTVWISHTKMGMIPQPSKARKFFAACLRQPIANAIEIANFPEDLIGKQVYVSTMNKKSTKGGLWTRAEDFRPIKIERKSGARAERPVAAEEPLTNSVTVNSDDLTDEIKF